MLKINRSYEKYLSLDLGDAEGMARENRVGVVTDRFEEEAYKNAARQLSELGAAI